MCLAVTIFYFFCNYASSTEATCVLGVDKDNKKCFALFTGAAYRLTIKNVFMTAIAAINQVLQPPTKSIAVFNIFYISTRLQGRDSGNDFRVPKIGLDYSRFLFILFLYPQDVPSRFTKRPSFLGTDFHFWS